MALYAADDIDDALAATRRLFTPVRVWFWARLALLALFIGGGASPPTSGFQFSGAPPGTGGDLPSLSPRLTLLVLVVVAVGLVVLLVLAALASVFEFVFVEALREGELSLRRGVAHHWRRGLRLFGFRVVVGVLSLLAVGILVGALVAPFVLAVPLAVALLFVLVALPLLLLVAVVAGLVNGFTTVFVVPTVLLTERGILDSWRRLWPTIRGNLKQYAAYAVIGFVLNIVGGLVVGVVVAVAGLLLAIPAVAVGAVALAVGPVFLVLAAVVWALLGLVALAVVAFVQAPVQAFLRYHALFVLGDVDADLDYISDVRRDVRE